MQVMAGRDAGKSGRVLSINAKNERVVVEHVNMIKRHTRPNPQKNIKGGIVEREASIHISNVMLVCPSAASRRASATRSLPTAPRSRICRQCDATLDK